MLVGVFFALVAGLCFGVVIGRLLERYAWVVRGDGETAHYAAGKFWYIRSGDQVGRVHSDRCKLCDRILTRHDGPHYCWECAEKTRRDCRR